MGESEILLHSLKIDIILPYFSYSTDICDEINELSIYISRSGKYYYIKKFGDNKIEKG